jgi:alpha-1,3-rhamnosyl/mannosyltransferase
VRIGVDARFIGRDRRGMGRYVSSLLEAFAACGSEHEIVLLDDRAASNPPRDIDVCWHPWNRADLSLPGAVSVVTIHDLAPLATPRPGVFRTRSRRHDVRRIADAVTNAGWIVAVSDFTRNEILARFPCDPARVVVIPEGVSPSFFAEPCPRPAGPLLWVGTDEPRKNLACLVEAFARLRRGGRDIRLTLCGDNSNLLVRYRRALRQVEADAVVATGYLSDDALSIQYRHARLFVCPSLYEGFGLPVLEAMASGTPVVCSRAAALPELAGDAAVYFDPGDVDMLAAMIDRCLGDDALCAALAARGRARAATLTWSACAARMLALFEHASCATPA